MFIEQLQSSALEDCAAFYESDITLLLTKYENSAVNETELLVCIHCVFLSAYLSPLPFAHCIGYCLSISLCI